MISIHALREESDEVITDCIRRALLFQSTLSARRATISYCRADSRNYISIHALREESDQLILQVSFHLLQFQSTLSARRATFSFGRNTLAIKHFNPRSPRGERPLEIGRAAAKKEFQSTLSARRATCDFLITIS